MNGVPPPFGQPPPQAQPWQEHRTPDGRVYFYNTITKVTQWTKPEDLMSSAERALANQPWKEYTAQGGRKYWYNTETKESSWEMPDVYRQALGLGPESTTPRSATPYGGGPGGSDYSRDYRDAPRDSRDSRQMSHAADSPAQPFFVPASNDPEYASPEEAEAAFVKMLRRFDVGSDWTWEQTVRATVRDPQHRAIKDPRERKVAFEKYCQDMVAEDRDRAKERLSKLRADFETMLKRHPEIKYYTRWKTARPMIEGETLFRSTDNENERRQLFYEYRTKLRQEHVERQAAMRKDAMSGLIDLLSKLNLEPYTRWSDAQGIISSTQPFQSEEKYQALSKFDILTAFQNHMKALERAFNDSKQEQKNMKYRKERKNRDAFIALLSELRRAGKINAGTKWRQIHPLIEKDERYLAMAGQPGSTPQELFWDVVEEEERGLRGTRNDVLDVIDDKRFEVTAKTTFDEFLSVVKDDRRTANIDRDILLLIFERVQEKTSRRPDDDRHSERQQRRAADGLRSYMKHLDPPLTTRDTYDKVRTRITGSEDFQALASEDARRVVFDKFLRRLREREEDHDRDRHRRRDRASVDRDAYRDRDRSRGERSYRGGGRSSRRSRSPEVDPYEADRRKAIAERERNHRKATMAESALVSERHASPAPRRDRDRERDTDRDRDRHRERDRDRGRERDRERDRSGRDHERDRERGRDRDYDRPPRSRRDEDSYYDRERRSREEERERIYRRRTERGGSYDELPYGDERPATATRRRRPEDDEDRRDSKRPRREKSREPTEPTPQKKPEDKVKARSPLPKDEASGVHSGSEEGEIEED